MAPVATKWARFAAQLDAAVAHHRAGRLDRASRLYRRILEKAPDHPDALHMLGVIATSQGKPQDAICLIGRAMGALANFADAHLNLGNAHHVAGRRRDAIECYRRAVQLRPGFAAAHSSLGRELNLLGAHAEALSISQRAIALDPAMPEAWLHAGAALRGLGRLGEAEASLREALARRPDFVEALQTLGVIAVETSRFEDAVALQQRVVQLRPNDHGARRALGVYLFRTGQTAAALDELRHAVTLAPDFVPGWTSLGWTHRALGQFEEAIACFERALQIDPESAEARRSLTATGRTEASEAELARLAEFMDDTARPSGDRVAAGFAHGELLDKMDRFDEAFASFAKANALARRALVDAGRAYDAEGVARRVDGLIAGWTPDLFRRAAAAGIDSERPVFIVGMPRTGTTLVEQIVSSHSQAFGAGELTEIGKISDQLPPLLPDSAELPAWASSARRLGSAHLERLGALGAGALRVVDKLPDNLFHLGLIAALFPRARVIFCERDPRDVCLSNYFQLFAGGNPWSYDLIECAHRYRQAALLADHWRQVLPLAWLNVNYEALVADLEGESRRIVEFLGLDWEPGCLEFYRTERVVITQSTWQVRQKLYTRSVGRWRHYQRHLGPLLSGLEASAI